MSDLPANSFKSKNDKEKNLKNRVTKGVAVRKKPLGRKFAETMFNTDVRSAKQHIVGEFIIPSVLNFLRDCLHEMVDTFINNDGSSYRYSSSGSKTDYGKYFYKSVNGSGKPTDSSPVVESVRSPYDAYECLFDDRGEAERVLDDMRSVLGEFPAVTLNDYYELIGKTSELGSSTDANFGWTKGSLDRVTISTVRVGRERKYVINLPRLEQLK